jgi:hypothetical protein
MVLFSSFAFRTAGAISCNPNGPIFSSPLSRPTGTPDRQRMSLRNSKNFRVILAGKRRMRQHGVAGAKIDADAEFGLRDQLSIGNLSRNPRLS